MSQKAQRKTPAQARADEALDRVAQNSSTPTSKALDFLLRGSHDGPATTPAASPGTSPAAAPPVDPPPSLATQASPAKPAVQALPEAGHDSQASPAIETRLEHFSADILASLPAVSGYLKLGNQIVDHLLPQLEPYEQLAYLQLYRLSHGNGKPYCLISMPKLAKRTKVSERSLWRAVAALEDKGLVRKTATTHGKAKEQGITYWVATPASPAGRASHDTEAGHDREAHNKRNTLKDTHITTASVRVGSRFALLECRRYAESLRSDGITNPGGYATRIHRSGEADELIAAFLDPTPTQAIADISQCPDCRGTGFYEPGGTGKGVARCRHERLTSLHAD